MRIPHLLAAAALLTVACTPPAAAQQIDAGGTAVSKDWSYTGPTGPDFWASPLGYDSCAGSRQSPVDLPARTAHPPLPITLSYPAANPGRLVNTGHTVDFYLLNQATLRVGDTTFVYREIHFHVPAEHLVQGVRHAAEIHAVHTAGADAAVLTTFVEAGPHNGAWDALIAGMPGNKGDTIPIGPTDVRAMLALDGLDREWIYSYAGSLTTPDCSPSVGFLIRLRPIVLSQEQIDALAAAFGRNVRPVRQTASPITLHRGAP